MVYSLEVVIKHDLPHKLSVGYKYVKQYTWNYNIRPKLLKSFNQLTAKLCADTTKYTLELATNKHSSNHTLYCKYKRLIAKEKYMHFWCHVFCFLYWNTRANVAS